MSIEKEPGRNADLILSLWRRDKPVHATGNWNRIPFLGSPWLVIIVTDLSHLQYVSLNSHISVSSFVVIRNKRNLNFFTIFSTLEESKIRVRMINCEVWGYQSGGSDDSGCVGRDAVPMNEQLSWCGRSADGLNSEWQTTFRVHVLAVLRVMRQNLEHTRWLNISYTTTRLPIQYFVKQQTELATAFFFHNIIRFDGTRVIAL